MNLEHCFTVLMTTHSISILSKLEMPSFDSYAVAKNLGRSALHQLR